MSYRVIENLVAMLEAEKEGSKSSNDSNAKLFNNHGNRDAKINIGAKPGDRNK